MIGQKVSHYRILRELGKGAMSVVYLAEDKRLRRRVAIKMLDAEHLTRTSQNHSRLLREARAISQINHPNIATIYDYGETQDGQPFIVMEYIEGKTLSDTLKQRKLLPVSRSVEIIAAVAAALSEAHSKGIIHRDIKPSNIIINQREEVKVLDFGLAKQIEGFTQIDVSASVEVYAETQTREGVVVGTPLYLSPEQALGSTLDGRSDIFSLGSVFYECLTGQSPFQAPSVIEICAKILKDTPLPPSQLNPGIPIRLDSIVLKALAKNSDHRYQTASDFVAELTEIKAESTSEQSAFPKDSQKISFFTQDTIDDKYDATDEKSFNATAKHALITAGNSLSKIFTIPSRYLLTQKSKLLASLILIFAASAVYLGFWVFNKPNRASRQPFQFQRISLPSGVKEAVISPDGKFIAGVAEESGKQSIHIMELSTSGNIPVVEPADKIYGGLSFSKDGEFVYYLEYEGETATLYRVSKFSGGRKKLLNNVNTPVTFSPDNKSMAFIRYDKKNETTVLMTANTDGTNERTLATRTFPEEYTLGGKILPLSPSWSPDGETIACSITNRGEGNEKTYIELVNAKDASKKRFSNHSWYLINKISWLADGSGLLIGTSEKAISPTKLNLITYPNGEIIPITHDPNTYFGLSATADSKTLLVQNLELSSSIWVVNPRDGNQPSSVPNSQNKGILEVGWLNNDEIFYLANDSNKTKVWRESVNGNSSPREIFNTGNASHVTAASDGSFLALASDASGSLNVWRVNADGSNSAQLTKTTNAYSPQIMPDKKTILYSYAGNIWSISPEGNNESQFFKNNISLNILYPTVSSDGLYVAYINLPQTEKDTTQLQVRRLDNGELVKRFALPANIKLSVELHWTPDNKGITYINNKDGKANVWVQPLDGTEPKPLTNFNELEILDYAWSPNGQKLICVRGMKVTKAALIKDFSWE